MHSVGVIAKIRTLDVHMKIWGKKPFYSMISPYFAADSSLLRNRYMFCSKPMLFRNPRLVLIQAPLFVSIEGYAWPFSSTTHHVT